MGTRTEYREKRIREVTAPQTGQVFRLRRINLAEWCDILGGLPSIAEKTDASSFTVGKLRELEAYQRKVIAGSVVSPAIAPDDSNDEEALTFRELDPDDVAFLVRYVEGISGTTKEAAGAASRFPEEQGGGAPA